MHSYPIPTLAALLVTAGTLAACGENACDMPPAEPLTAQNALAPIAWWHRAAHAIARCPAAPTPPLSPPGAIRAVGPSTPPYVAPRSPPSNMIPGGATALVAPAPLPPMHARHRARH